jgi:2-dehydropantoate 2-reductase
MQFVVLGAGAIGGVVAARLFEAGHDVVAVARGAHREAMAAHGLELRSPSGTTTLRLPVASDPQSVAWAADSVVLLAVKSQQTGAALGSLRGAVAETTPVVCLQNGVANEGKAARSFSAVYGVSVMCPTLHLEPGVVEASSSPTTGILDIGRYPSGRDALAEAVAAAFSSATFQSAVRDDIMRWKWSKLLTNLGNIIEAACGPPGRRSALAALVRKEGEACLRAAGIDFVSAKEDAERRGDILRVSPVSGRQRPGGSTWQSLARGTGDIETDFLNGEVARLGALHSVPTPANELLCALGAEMAARRVPPGSYAAADLLARLA